MLQSSANDCAEFIFWPEAVPVTCSLRQTLLLQVPVEKVLCLQGWEMKEWGNFEMDGW